MNVRPYKPFKQDNVKKVTVLIADTTSKIFELGFSGVISVLLTLPLDEYHFSPTRGSNIKYMVSLQIYQKEAEMDNRKNEIPRVHYLMLLLRTLTSNSTPVTTKHICESTINLMSIINV